MALLEVEDLHTGFAVEGRMAWAVQGVSFKLDEGEFLGIVGESGSGKSVTALSVLRLVPDPPGKIAKGKVLLRGRDLLSLSWPEMRKVRGKDIAMIFQEPMTSLNPVLTIGAQVEEVVLQHEGVDRATAKRRVVDVLDAVGIPDGARRLADYPHQFSGGMRQRVMIAMALVCKPGVLIADEPTTALDVTIQAQILDLLRELSDKGTAIILITHDLAVVAETCDRVAVMYGGRIQETSTVADLFDRPLHPYTQGLLGSIPDRTPRGQPLVAIPGNVPSIFELPPGCKFSSRCARVVDRCGTEPEMRTFGLGHEVRCHRAEEP